eukprot:4581293-Prymnesium_polylepis.4
MQQGGLQTACGASRPRCGAPPRLFCGPGLIYGRVGPYVCLKQVSGPVMVDVSASSRAATLHVDRIAI